MVDLVDRLSALMNAEVNAYRTVDYMSAEHQQDLFEWAQVDRGISPPVVADPVDFAVDSLSSSSSSSSHSGINEVWREKICEWSYQVIDHFDFSREVVAVSVHYLDRYLGRVPVTKKSFQLVAMTALYLAIKVYEPGSLSMTSMIELSRGFFSPEQMETMELAILRTLSWRVNPPTAYCFCKHILFVLPQTCVSLEVRYEILELARFLTELSVIDYYFVIHRPSDVALAALLNAMEEATGPAALATMAGFAAELAKIRGGGLIDPHRQQVVECRCRLQILYTQGGYSRQNLTSSPEEVARDTRYETISPVSVTWDLYQGHPYAQPVMAAHDASAATSTDVKSNADGVMGVDIADMAFTDEMPMTTGDHKIGH